MARKIAFMFTLWSATVWSCQQPCLPNWFPLLSTAPSAQACPDRWGGGPCILPALSCVAGPLWSGCRVSACVQHDCWKSFLHICSKRTLEEVRRKAEKARQRIPSSSFLWTWLCTGWGDAVYEFWRRLPWKSPFPETIKLTSYFYRLLLMAWNIFQNLDSVSSGLCNTQINMWVNGDE